MGGWEKEERNQLSATTERFSRMTVHKGKVNLVFWNQIDLAFVHRHGAGALCRRSGMQSAPIA